MMIFRKTVIGVLDYMFDWTAWLAAGETISSYVLTVPGGITQTLVTSTTKTVTVWLSGGTADVSYIVGCKIITSQGRTDERDIQVDVVTTLERSS